MSSSLKKGRWKIFSIFAIFSKKCGFLPKIEKRRGLPYFYNIGQKNTGKKGQKTREMTKIEFLSQFLRFLQNRQKSAIFRFLHIFRGNFGKISAEAAHFFKKSVSNRLLKHKFINVINVINVMYINFINVINITFI